MDEIQNLLFERYRTLYNRTTIENRLFRLSKKEFVRLYVQNHILFVHKLVTREAYRERTGKQIQAEEEKYRNSFWGRLAGRQTGGNEEEEKELERVEQFLKEDKD